MDKSDRFFTTVTPTLGIETTQDSAVSYTWAKGLSNYITASRLMTLKGEGHTGYGWDSACIDTVVDRYFIKEIPRFKSVNCNL